jgi:hypothetical protein
MACRSFRINGVAGIVCGLRRSRPKRCSHKDCKAPGTKLCDWPIGDGKTCDKPLCDRHAVRVGDDTDYCRGHEPGYHRGMVMDHHQLPPCPWEREAKIAVIRAYQAARRGGKEETACIDLATEAFRSIHPEMGLKNCGQAAIHIIAWASKEHTEWFWRGCAAPYKDRRRPMVVDPVTGYQVPGPDPV